METSRLNQLFTDLGGTFLTPADELARKLADINAVIFDWDGVFNGGVKGVGISSTFNEADSMGTNMLRYGLWRRTKTPPVAAIISGEKNQTALFFAKREHFQDCYIGISDKMLAFQHLCENHKLIPQQTAYVFDDLNDLGIAKQCGLRFMINRPASPLLKEYARENKLCDYITGNDSLNNAVREITELSLGSLNSFTTVIESRIAYDEDYQEYFQQRQSQQTDCYTQAGGIITSI